MKERGNDSQGKFPAQGRDVGVKGTEDGWALKGKVPIILWGCQKGGGHGCGFRHIYRQRW